MTNLFHAVHVNGRFAAEFAVGLGTWFQEGGARAAVLPFRDRTEYRTAWELAEDRPYLAILAQLQSKQPIAPDDDAVVIRAGHPRLAIVAAHPDPGLIGTVIDLDDGSLRPRMFIVRRETKQ